MLGHAKGLCVSFAFAGAVSAIGNATVKNNCAFPVTVWSVGSELSPGSTIKKGESYSERFARDPEAGGRALKITREADGLFTGKPQTVFAYHLRDGAVCYDLSDVFGDAFAGHRLVEGAADTSCPSIVWPEGTPPAGSQVKNCHHGADVTLTLCSN
ncbi:hypothetical protein C2857_006987 [Epichloe festucae Fl1]|uniref:Blastomyces yeast-phase-specific protein n=1 Tax=Epichloe festucae (strain Fl1) TaxID=877507 RepID=A0A7S9KTT6_EPIFF|nr:hypothetical protein C2857_006987 [Epichloe festucae Fl1]